MSDAGSLELTSHMIRASIIIVNYKTLDYLQACLTSLQPTITPFDEVIVVDNDSNDNCAEVLPANFPWVNLILSDENLGIGGGNNLGAKHARGEFLAFINPDTVVTQGWLDNLIETLETNPDAGLSTSKILLTKTPDRLNTCGNDMHISGLTLCRGMNEPSNNFPNREYVSAVSGAAFVIKKHLFDKLGGFDESFFIYMEDADLSLRARLAGFSCMYEPESIIHHDYTLTFGPNKTFYQERNRYMMLLKTFSFSTLLLLLPVLLLAELVSWGFVILKDRSRWKNKFRAFGWIVRNWKVIMSNRADAQALRQTSDRELIGLHTFKLDFDQVGSGIISTGAHIIFDSLFFVFTKLAKLLIWR